MTENHKQKKSEHSNLRAFEIDSKFKIQNSKLLYVAFALALVVTAGVAFRSEVVQAVTFTGNILLEGNLSVGGTLSKGGGSFAIDHPLDPENKLLYHSFVESPDAKNIYDGVVALNARGEATVELPEYFAALNAEPRYQVKPIDAPMPSLHISREIEEGGTSFMIAGGEPGERVSWQVSATRKDPFIQANPIITEVEKGPDAIVEKGEYVYPDYYEDGGSSFGSGFFSRLFSRIF